MDIKKIDKIKAPEDWVEEARIRKRYRVFPIGEIQ